MSRDGRGIILASVAVLLLRLSLTDQYLLYLKPSMRPWLIVSGVLLAVLATLDLAQLRRPLARTDGHEGDGGHDHAPDGHAHDAHDEGHEHRHGLLPWSLVLPFLVVFAVGPSPLGAFMADRQPTRVTDTDLAIADGDLGGGIDRTIDYPALPAAVDGAVELGLDAFVSRAAYDPGRSMDGVRVRLVGFVSADEAGAGDTFLLTRFKLACCAADGYAISVRVIDADGTPAPDTWLEVEGFWVPHDGDELPEIDVFRVESVTEIEPPTRPYL